MPELRIDMKAMTATALDAIEKFSRDTTRHAKNVESAFAGANNAIKTIGVGISAAGIIAFAKSSLNAVAALDDLSEKTTLSVETLSQLQTVARIGGHSLEEVGGIAGKFSQNMAKAAAGNQGLIANFKDLGISLDDLKNKNFDQLFVQFGTTVANAANKQAALALAAEVAGKSAREAAPFFNDLAQAGLQAATVTTQQAEAAEKAQKAFGALSNGIAELRDRLLIDALPALNAIAGAMAEAARAGEGFFSVIGTGIRAYFTGTGSELNKLNKEIVESTDALLRLQNASLQGGAATGRNKNGTFQDSHTAADELKKKIDGLIKQRDELEKKAAPFTAKGAVTNVGTASLGDKAKAPKKTGKTPAEEEAELFAKASLTRLKMMEEAMEESDKIAKALQDSIANLFSDTDFGKAAKFTEEFELLNKAFAGGDIPIEAYSQKLQTMNEAIDKTAMAAKETRDAVDNLISNTAIEQAKKMQAQVDELNRRLDAGTTSAAHRDQALKEILKDTGEETKKAKTLAEELGLVFKSSFEGAIESGGKFWDLVKGLGKDLLKLFLRKQVTEPALEAFGKIDWGSIFGGGKASGGATRAGHTYLVGEKGPELWRSNLAGSITPNNMLSSGGITYAPTFNIDSRTDRMAIEQRIKEEGRRTVSTIQELNRRGQLSFV